MERCTWSIVPDLEMSVASIFALIPGIKFVKIECTEDVAEDDSTGTEQPCSTSPPNAFQVLMGAANKKPIPSLKTSR